MVGLGFTTLNAAAAKPENDLLRSLLNKTDSTVTYREKPVFWNHKKKDGDWCRSTDTRGDGKPHVSDCFATKRLVSHARDWNGDGKSDEFITFQPDGSIVRHFDSHFKGKANLQVTIAREGKYILRKSQKNEGAKTPAWKTISLGRYPAVQEDDEDGSGSSSDDAEAFKKMLEKYKGLDTVVNPFEKLVESDSLYELTHFGFQIEKLCVQVQPKIVEMFHETLSEGVQCLWNQGGEGKAHVAAIGTLLLKAPSPRLMCSFNEPWGSRKVVSSLSSNDAFIVINPRFAAAGSSKAFKRKMFHELFHPALGVAHGIHVDYANACASCCFPGDAKAHTTSLACNICSRRFPEETDNLEYLTKLSGLLADIHQSDLAIRPILQFIKKHQTESSGRTAKFILIKVLSGATESPLGSALAKEFGIAHSDAEKKVLTAARLYDAKPWSKPYAKASAQIVTAISRWYQGYDESTAELLRTSEYPTAGVDPKAKAIIERTMDRTRLVLAEMVYDAFRFQNLKEKMQDFEDGVLAPLEKRLNEN